MQGVSLVDPSLVLWWLCFVLITACALGLGSLSFLLDVHPETRFRLITAAVATAFVSAGMFFGTAVALVGFFVGLWIYAVAVGIGKTLAGDGS